MKGPIGNPPSHPGVAACPRFPHDRTFDAPVESGSHGKSPPRGMGGFLHRRQIATLEMRPVSCGRALPDCTFRLKTQQHRMKSKPNPWGRASSRSAAFVFMAITQASQAAPRYWDVSNVSGLTAGNGTWGTSSFWATTASPGTTAPGTWTAGSDAFFQTGGSNTVAIVAGGVSATSVTQTTSGTQTTISSGGGSLTITGAAGIVNSGNATFTINSAVILGGTNTYTFNAGSTITLGGAISQTGTAGINKTGTSILNLNAANSYSGGTTVSAGRLIVGPSGTLGSNVNTNNISVSAGGSLGLSAASNVGSNQTISINSSSSALGGVGVGYSGTLPALDTSGTTTFGGVFGINYTGTAGVTSLATLSSSLNTGGASGQWFLGSQGTGNFNGSSLAAAGDNIYRLGGGGGTLTFSQTNVITGANAVRIGANLTGAGGTVVFGAAQNYTGDTTINGSSTLRLGHAGALGDGTTNTSGVTVNNTGIFDFGGISPTANVTLNLNSTANGFDVGSLANSVATAVTFGGAVNLQAATVRVGSAGSNGGNITLTGTITGNGRNFIKDSPNVMTLSNSGSVSLGTLQVFRGTLLLNSGTSVNPSGNTTLGGGASVGTSLTLNGGSLTVGSAQTATFGAGSGSASSTLTLTNGTLTVPKLTKGSQNYSINFNGGTLKANAASTTFLASGIGGTAKVQAGGAFIDDGGFAITVGQDLVHDSALGTTLDGGLSKSGGGTLTLSGASTYTGPTLISQGTLALSGSGSIASSSAIRINASSTFDVSGVTGTFTVGSSQMLSGSGSVVGALNIAGTLSPGNSPGNMTTGSQTWLDDADYNWQIADAAGVAGVGYDTMTIAGSLDLTNLGPLGFHINLWSLSSTLPDVNGSALNFSDASSYTWVLASTSGGISGFDAGDFLIHTAANNGSAGFANAFTGNFGVSVSGNDLVLTYTAVPEPRAALLGCFAMLAMLRRRR